MKKLIPILLAVLFVAPAATFAISIPWDRAVVGTINPLFILDTVKANIFTATSTTQASTFPYASTTALSWTATSTGSNGIALSGGCFQMPSGTCLSAGGSGTVTSITGGTGLNGGTITAAGTLSLVSYLATSSAETNGQIPYWTSSAATPAKLGSVATGTLSATSPLSLSATRFVIGGADALSWDFSVANIWTGLQQFAGNASSTQSSVFTNLYVGGTATTTIQGNTTGTSTFQGFINVLGATNSTSTFSGNVRVSGNLQVDGTFFAPVSLTAGGDLNMATFNINNVGTITATNATVNTTLKIPFAADPTVNASGITAINTTQASTSIRYYDGTAERNLPASQPKSMIIASSTLSYFSAASTTLNIMNSAYPTTLTRYFCKTDTGTVNIQFGTGSASSTMLTCNTTGVGTALNPANATYTMFQNVFMEIGTQSSLGRVTITTMVRSDQD